MAGVYLVRCSNCTITDNDLSDNYLGIYLRYSDYNKILNNAILGKNRGIHLQDSNYNTLSDNRADCNDQYGIYLLRSQGNTLSNNIANLNNHGIVLENTGYNNLAGNTANSNKQYGFYLTGSSNCGLTGNTAANNERGIYLIRSNSTTISGNTVLENTRYGILISYSNSNTISGNTANKTTGGIFLDSAGENTVSGNTVALNSISGLYMCPGSRSNRVFNNYLNNTYNADVRSTANAWNTTRTAGKNIAGGSYIGGNFWANPTGTGFSQTAQDANGDGIADVEYAGTNFTDYLPLASISGSQQPVLPVANFTTSTTSGNAPLTVQFTDKSQYATGRSWDFDNNGIADSITQDPVYVYTVPGTYTVNLTSINMNGTNSKVMTITVYAQAQPVLPVANFTANITSGYAPLAVQFTDLSQNAVLWSWDFDSDGNLDSDLQNPAYVYETPGIYTVSLIAGNRNGTASKTATIYVEEEQGGHENNVLPTIDFSMNVSEGYAPLSVLFTDLSQNASWIGWDFNNDGLAEVDSGTVVYVYTVPGSYTVSLSATNENGTTSKTATITVLKEGGGGGGGGGSPEPAKNVEIKELSQVFITNGNTVKFDFAKNATCVVYVSFDAKKTVGKTTTIVEQLKGKSALVSELPSDEIYKSFNVWVGNGEYATPKNINNPVLRFKVEKSWVRDKKINPDSIALNRYSDKKWDQVPAALFREDKRYMYFTAEVPGFSFFAITGKTETLPEENVTRIEPVQGISSIEKEGVENTGSELEKEPGQGKMMKVPGFEMVFGIVYLLSVFMYKRK